MSAEHHGRDHAPGDHAAHAAQASFDDRAATWDDDPVKVERAETVARAIRREVPLDGTTRLLEYGAGTGLVTQALRDAVGPVTLADPSQGMREVIRTKVDAGVLHDARVWDLDLAVQPAPDERFDAVVTVMAMHHVPDIDAVLAGFADLLVTGGHLCIADLDREDGSFHGEGFEGHRGFDRARLTEQLGRAGFTEVSFVDLSAIVRDDGRYPLFLATGVRA